MDNAQDEIQIETDVKDALQAGVEALNQPEPATDDNDDDAEVENVDQVERLGDDSVDADEVKAAIESGVTALNQSVAASETSEQVPSEPEDDSDVKDAIQQGVKALNTDDNDAVTSAPIDETPIETVQPTVETNQLDNEDVKDAIEQGVDALNKTTSDSDVAEVTVINNETITEDTTLVAEPVDEVKDAISAGVEALNAKPADEEVEADILVIETPDVEIDNDTDEVQTPETLVNEAIMPLATATGESKSVDQARQRSPTPQIESDEEEEVVEPSHVETVDTKVAETPVDKPVASKETIGTVFD